MGQRNILPNLKYHSVKTLRRLMFCKEQSIYISMTLKPPVSETVAKYGQ